MSDLNREPIFWSSTTPGYNTADRERSFMRDGEEITIRFPQRGHSGDYDDRTVARGLRYVDVVRHDGNIAPMVLTNAAAHLDPNTSFGHYQRSKARHYGWFTPGSCPVALLATGELTPAKIFDKSILDQKPCMHGTHTDDNPCPHALAEIAARRTKKQAVELARNAAYKDPTDRMIEAGREQNQAFAQTVADALAKASKAGK